MPRLSSSRKACWANRRCCCAGWNRLHVQRNWKDTFEVRHGTSSAGESFDAPRQGNGIGSSGTRDDHRAAVGDAESQQANLREKVHGT